MPPPTANYTLSLHDALPIFSRQRVDVDRGAELRLEVLAQPVEHPLLELARPLARHPVAIADLLQRQRRDRKSTRLNSSHRCTSYAVFCLKKKKQTTSSIRRA